MANITYDIIWRDAMTDLLEQLDAENPEDPSLAPTTLGEFSCTYIKYLQIYKKLEMAYDQMVHPQKRIDLRKALEACIGRLLEIRYWMVKLNDNKDFVNLDDILVDLKLSPDVLEVPVPRYYVDDRASELQDRERFLVALMQKYELTPIPDIPPIYTKPSTLTEDEAATVIQKHERGRQARVRISVLRKQKQVQEEELRHQRQGGEAISQDVAAVRIQAAVRGFLARRKTKRMAEEELIFIGMKPLPRDVSNDPILKERSNMARRKKVQAGNHLEYEDAVVAFKAKVKEQEGQDMREVIQDKINKWFLENRDPVTGDYPDFPDKEDGGSKIILNPPPLIEEPPPEDDKKKKKEEKAAKDKKGKDGKKGKEEPPKEEKPEVCPVVFVKHIRDSVQAYCATWQDKDESTNFHQKHDTDLIRAALRPLIFEEVRVEVDEEMKVLLENLKDMVAAEKAARLGKKLKKGAKKKKKKAKKKGKKEKGKKKRKDITADRSVESLYAELVSNGILQRCPSRSLAEYVGSYNYLGNTLEKANITPDPSMAQVRQLVTEYCVLPLGSTFIHESAPFKKSVLLFGHKACGKTLLVHAACRAAGANLFNLTPRNTDGKYPGKQVVMMIHMVFKVAKLMAPSVIYIDEVEKVFLTDKKKSKEYAGTELCSRIKKELIKEMKVLVPGERVLLIGTSSKPNDCTSTADTRNLMNFFSKHIHVPFPDYASLKLLWPALAERAGGELGYSFDVSTLAHLSQGYSPGVINHILRTIFTNARIARLKQRPLAIEEVVKHLHKFSPLDKESDQALREWMKKLPANKPKTPPVDAQADKKGKAKGKVKGKGK